MKKIIIAVAIMGIFSFTSLAIAKSEPNGDPFQAIWNAINDIKNQIANIQLTPGPKGDKGDKGDQGIQGETGLAGSLEAGHMSVPAFDSGWIDMPNGDPVKVDHNVRGDPNNYYIYISYKKWDGSLITYKSELDAVWLGDINSNNLTIYTNRYITTVYSALRIRIWKINQQS
jgi:hypothetical protein